MSKLTGKAGAVSVWRGPAFTAAVTVFFLLAAMACRPAAALAAITPTVLTSGSNSNSVLTYTTASITPKANALILLFVDSHLPGKTSTPAVTGNGLTWELVTSVDWKTLGSPDDRIAIFRAVGAAPTTGSVTMTYTIAQNNVLWTVMQFERADITPAAVKQYVTSFSESIYYMAIGLAPLQTSANASVGVFCNDSDKGVTAGAGYTASQVLGSGPNRSFIVEWQVPGSTTVDVNFVDNKAAAGIAVEIGIGVVTTLGNGTDPDGAALPPGGPATEVDAFTFVTDRETSTVTDVTVTLAAGTSPAIGLVEIVNQAGTVLGSLANPASDTPKVTLTSPITVTTAGSAYKIRITPKSHAAMPAPAGSSYSVTARVTDWTDYSNHEGADTGSATVTIDNLSPANVTGANATPGDAEATVTWTNPADPDLAGVIVLRRLGVAVADAPVEGQSYAAGDSVGGASTVACVASSPNTSCTAANLLNASTYYFKIFTKDSNGNYSLNGVSASPLGVTPQHYQPDVLIKLSSEGDAAYLTDNTYESSANVQAKSQGVPSGSTATYRLRFQNDGSTSDKLVITGTGNGSNFSVQYLDPTAVDQTASVTGAGFTTPYLAVGAFQDWTLQVTPNGGGTPVAGGTPYPVLVTAKSWASAAKSDQAKAVSTSTSANLALVKNADKASCRPGEDITYTIAGSNGASLTSANTVVVTDPVPANTGFRVGSALFNPGTSTLTCAVSYSNGSWGYTPVSGGCGAPAGYDYCVAQVKWTMAGSMPTGTSFTVSMAVRVK